MLLTHRKPRDMSLADIAAALNDAGNELESCVARLDGAQMIDSLARTIQPGQCARLLYQMRERLYAEFNHNAHTEDAVREIECAADALTLMAQEESRHADAEDQQ